MGGWVDGCMDEWMNDCMKGFSLKKNLITLASIFWIYD